MSLSIYMKGCYEDFSDFERRKNKANSKPISVSPQIYSGGWKAIWKNKANLHKAIINVSIYIRREYEIFCGFGLRENKANQSQTPAFGRKSEAMGGQIVNRK